MGDDSAWGYDIQLRVDLLRAGDDGGVREAGEVDLSHVDFGGREFLLSQAVGLGHFSPEAAHGDLRIGVVDSHGDDDFLRTLLGDRHFLQHVGHMFEPSSWVGVDFHLFGGLVGDPGQV